MRHNLILIAAALATPFIAVAAAMGLWWLIMVKLVAPAAAAANAAFGG